MITFILVNLYLDMMCPSSTLPPISLPTFQSFFPSLFKNLHFHFILFLSFFFFLTPPSPFPLQHFLSISHYLLYMLFLFTLLVSNTREMIRYLNVYVKFISLRSMVSRWIHLTTKVSFIVLYDWVGFHCTKNSNIFLSLCQLMDTAFSPDFAIKDCAVIC